MDAERRPLGAANDRAATWYRVLEPGRSGRLAKGPIWSPSLASGGAGEARARTHTHTQA